MKMIRRRNIEAKEMIRGTKGRYRRREAGKRVVHSRRRSLRRRGMRRTSIREENQEAGQGLLIGTIEGRDIDCYG